MSKDIQTRHDKTYKKNIGEKRPPFIINYYSSGGWCVENNDNNRTVAAGERKYTPLRQSFPTFLGLPEAIELAKMRANEYRNKFAGDDITSITVRVTQKTANTLAAIHGNKSRGAEIAVKAYAEIRPRILQDMKARFSREELSYLVDISNGHLFQPEMSGVGFWIAQIEDADSLDGLGKKWDVDVASLIEKVRSMNSAEIYFWQETINRFWYGPNKGHDLDWFLNEWGQAKFLSE